MAWVRVAKIGDFADGKAQLAQIEGKSIALVKAGDHFYAISDQCPHREGPLHEGYQDDKYITCPWHAWTFDVTTGLSTTVPGAKVKTYPIKIEGENIFVEVD